MRILILFVLFCFFLSNHARTPMKPINRSINQSINHSTDESTDQSIDQSTDQSISQPNVFITAQLTANGSIIIDGQMYQLSINQLTNQPTNQPIRQPINQPIDQSTRRRSSILSLARSVKDSIISMIPSQSTDQSTSQSINQPINLFTHRSITHQSITDQSINDQSVHRQFYEDECEPALISPKSAEFYIYIGAILALLLGGGLISGLTIGLFSLSHLELAVLTNDSAADLKDRKRAKKLRPLLREDRHHLLLVTLLLTNTGCMEALPELLDKLVPEWAAVVISVSLVVLFSEILPQAICTRAPLAVGAFFSPLCWLLMLIMFPIAWPISKALDWLIGAGEGAQFLASRSQVTSLLEIIQENHVLSEEEASIMKAVISIKQKTIKEVMIDASDVYMLEMNEKLTASTLQEILRIGHSRIPVYRGSNKANIQGMLLTKRLIVARPEDEDPVSKYLQSTTALLDQTINQPHHHTSNRTTHSDHVLKPIWVKPDTEVFTLLDEFQRARCHLAIVADDLSEVALAYHADKDIVNMTEIRGIVTMEDLVEIVLEIDIKEREHEDGIDKQFVVDSDDELPSRKPRIVDPRSAQQSTLNEMLSNLTILAEQKARTKSRITNKPVMPPLRRAKTTHSTNQSTSGSQTPTFNRSRRAINQPISRSPGSMLKQPLLLDEEAKENSSNSTRSRSNSNSLNRSINQSLSLSVDTNEKILPDTPEQSRCRSEAIFTPVSSWRRGASRRNLLSNLPVNIHPSIDQSINQSPSLNGKSPQMSWSDSPVLMEEHLPNGQTRVTIASKQDAEARLDVIDERINQPISSSSDDSSGDEGADLDIVSAFASKILDSIAAKRKHSSDEESTDEDTPTNQSTKSEVTSPTEKNVSKKKVKSPKESINQSTNQSTKSSHHHHEDDDDNLLATPHHLTGLVGPASLTS